MFYAHLYYIYSIFTFKSYMHDKTQRKVVYLYEAVFKDFSLKKVYTIPFYNYLVFSFRLIQIRKM